MITGNCFPAAYIVWFKLMNPELNMAEHWWLGISPEGIGTVGMRINFAVTMSVSRVTPEPPDVVQILVDKVRVPRGAGEAHEISV